MPTALARLTRLGSATLASVAVLCAGAGAAGAATAPSRGARVPLTTLAGFKTAANFAVTRRVNSLNAAVTKVNAAKGLGSGQSTLVTYLSADIAPLQQLNQKIQGDTTVQQAAADFWDIFTDYRVYMLVLPAAHIAGEADRVTNTTVPALTAASTKAQGLVDSQNQAELQPLIDDLNGRISSAANPTNGLASTVLAFTPAQWNANNDLLSSAKSSDKTAQAAVRKGRSDLRQIRRDVKGSGLSGRADTTTKTTTR
jgi:hypothetical protein